MKTNLFFYIGFVLYFNSSFGQTPTPPKPEKEFHIFVAYWDSWGRESQNCGSWGLCKFRSCAFCCTIEDVIVDCDDKREIQNTGKIFLNNLGEGYMVIALNSKYVDHYYAIKEKSTLYIDEDIYEDDIVLVKGEYPFDDRIGKEGGYEIVVAKPIKN